MNGEALRAHEVIGTSETFAMMIVPVWGVMQTSLPRFLFKILAVLLLAATAAAIDRGPANATQDSGSAQKSASGGAKQNPAKPQPKETEKPQEEKPPTPPAGSERKLQIQKMEPSAPTASPASQEITLTIDGAQEDEKLKVTFAGPDSFAPPEREEKVNNKKLTTTLSLPVAGKWSVTVSADKLKSQPFFFQVQSATLCQPVANSPAVSAFRKIVWVMNGALLVFFVPLILGLIAASFQRKNRWSLGDALAEESSCQPAEIHSRDDVVMVASSSRIIAVFGLFGILAIVIGVGYSIIWNLTVCRAAPDLSGIRIFLVGMAAVFAPYLANQLRETISPTNPPTEQAEKKASRPGPKITGISSGLPLFQANEQDVTFLGSGLPNAPNAMVLTLINPDGTLIRVDPPSVSPGGPTQFQARVLLNRVGNWKAIVTGSNGASTPAFEFRVGTPRPVITRVTVAPAALPNGDRQLAIDGNNFMPDIVANVTHPAETRQGTVAPGGTLTRIQVQVQMAAAADWQVVLRNPGNSDSETSTPFAVT